MSEGLRFTGVYTSGSRELTVTAVKGGNGLRYKGGLSGCTVHYYCRGCTVQYPVPDGACSGRTTTGAQDHVRSRVDSPIAHSLKRRSDGATVGRQSERSPRSDSARIQR